MSKKSQQDWVNGAIAALSDGGIDAVRIETIASALGVSKGSFYHHFTNRRSLLLALLDQWERLGTSAIIDLAESASDNPRDKLATLVRVACTPDTLGDAIEMSIRSWATNDPIAREAAARVDQRRLDYVIGLLMSSGLKRPQAKRRAAMFYRVIIGDTTWRMAGGPEHTRRDFDDLSALLLSNEPVA